MSHAYCLVVACRDKPAMSALRGLSGPTATVCYLSAFRSKADVHGRVASPSSVANDPKRTLARIRSRNAAALLRTAIYNLAIGGAQNGTLARPASNF